MKAYLIVALSCMAFPLWSQNGNADCIHGKVIEGQSMKSLMLKKDIPYSVYLPPDYDVSQRSYPVVYLLHGYSDDEIAWVQFGEVNITADRLIANREIPPMIIIMPDAEITWFINDYKNEVPYEDMIIDEFIPFIDKTYRTRKDREFRAVSGLSMGGYGSLVWALHHPETFSSCAAFSSAVHSTEEILEMSDEQYRNYFNFLSLYGPSGKTGRITDHWKKNSPIEIVKSVPKAEIEKVRFYIDCGDDDFLYRGNSMLHIAMRDKNIYHEYRVRDGAHGWGYWRNNIGEGLKFIGQGFHR